MNIPQYPLSNILIVTVDSDSTPRPRPKRLLVNELSIGIPFGSKNKQARFPPLR